jgi:hypothetical protein
MVNIYLFIELIRAASAPDVADRIKGLSLANCKFANVVVLSYDKLVAQLDCSTPEDGTRVVLEELPKVEGVVQTNVIAVVKPVHIDRRVGNGFAVAHADGGHASLCPPYASIPVDEALHAFMLGAMDAAEDRVAVLHAVADDAHAAMRADRRERGNGTFEGVEHERAAAHGDLEALVVIVAALRAFAHGGSSFD